VELETLDAISVSFLDPTLRNFLLLRRTADLDLGEEAGLVSGSEEEGE
jgi:hypothetical protein